MRKIRGHMDRMFFQTVEEMLSGLLEADRLCNTGRERRKD